MNHLKICRDCYEQRAARIRRQQFRNTVRGIAYAICIVIGGAIIVSFFRHSGTAPVNTIDNAATNMVADDGNTAVPDNQSAPMAAASDDVAVEDNATGVSQPTTQTQVTDQTAQTYQRPVPVMRAPDLRDEFARAINDATPRALESGQPEPWRAAGSNGYVVPSAPQAYGDRTCRNIFSTIFYGDRQRQSSSVQWCREGDGEWLLAN
ncbi:hypothetical protein [uncultured Sphingomonas sp.]|uniref:hypothetical protein n=1 Tax=uncultured Sphingomonas sp. TaxID=158754 RepID=UPI0035CA7594